MSGVVMATVAQLPLAELDLTTAAGLPPAEALARLGSRRPGLSDDEDCPTVCASMAPFGKRSSPGEPACRLRCLSSEGRSTPSR